MRGDDFWPHLKMCTNGSDLLPVLLNDGTMSGEMRSKVALMPVVIKSGITDEGTLYELFFGVFSLRGDIMEKLIKGQWWRLMTLMRF